MFEAGEGAGASGSFFFFSRDRRFIIKTLQGKEKQKLLDILDEYIKHLTKSSNKSLLARFYGIFEIRSARFSSIDLVLMENVAQLEQECDRKYSFDLKGSTVQRYTCPFSLVKLQQMLQPEERLTISKLSQRNLLTGTSVSNEVKLPVFKKVLKDCNFRQINRHYAQTKLQRGVCAVDSITATKLNGIIYNDSDFLRSQGIMDYSLFLVVESKQTNNS